jgi:L-ribulose-5-phosphate 3-epimerase
VAAESQRAGVALALEVADGLTHSADSIRALMPRIRGAPVWINFDTGNLPFYSGLDPVREFEGVHQFVAHVHVKDHVGGVGDYNFPAIGEGNLDMAAFFALVKRLDYRGPLSAEIEFAHPVDRPPARDITEAARVSRLAMEAYLAAA